MIKLDYRERPVERPPLENSFALLSVPGKENGYLKDKVIKKNNLFKREYTHCQLKHYEMIL